MNLRLFPILLLCGSVSSCDKIKELAGQAQKKTDAKGAEVSKQIPLVAPASASLEDKKFQAMVDQTPDGVMFRKDLPFPAKLEIISTETQTYKNALVFNTSELGRESARLEGTLTTENTLKRTGNQIVITLGKKVIVRDNPEKKDEPVTEVIQDGKAGKSLRLNLADHTWKPAPEGDFHSHNWADQIKGHVDELLIETGAISRNLWFGKKRLKIGDQVPLPQSNLPVIFDAPGTGNVMLTLLSIEPLHGHPCGVFSISGSYSTKDHQNIYGTKENTEMTIQSGKVWLSLLYPLVMKKELQTIMTSTTSSDGGLSGRVQGNVIFSNELNWKVLE